MDSARKDGKAAPVCGGCIRWERMGTAVALVPGMEPTGKDGNDSRTCVRGWNQRERGGTTAAPECGGCNRWERRATTVAPVPVMEPAGKQERNDSRTCAGDGAGGKGGERQPQSGSGWITATPPPSTETAEPRPRDGVSQAPEAVSGRDTGPCVPQNTGKREKHRLSRQGDSGNRSVLLSFIPAGTHRRIPPGCVPAPPARYSDGRHPAPVSRRRRRTPEVEWSPIGPRGANVRAGPPGGERGGGEFPDVGSTGLRVRRERSGAAGSLCWWGCSGQPPQSHSTWRPQPCRALLQAPSWGMLFL
ncbi:collagen alpha-1(III) chain-like [Passer domesticus]|uniref:collagen alpha-1(III) chain-like n=1 Tax=Passer domesticus TaxID=48849 RepID=UPI0030FE5687